MLLRGYVSVSLHVGDEITDIVNSYLDLFLQFKLIRVRISVDCFGFLKGNLISLCLFISTIY